MRNKPTGASKIPKKYDLKKKQESYFSLKMENWKMKMESKNKNWKKLKVGISKLKQLIQISNSTENWNWKSESKLKS